jgi:wyosine [tRNA(Phe)-imidazoG37] synthetase (radical SAM superfamily)
MKILAKKINDYKTDEFKIKTVKYCGTTGEPLLNPASVLGISLFKNLDKKFELYTNGLYLDKTIKGKKYLEYILDADKIILSLDAGSEETFEKIKQKTGYSRIISNLDELVQKRNSTNSKLNIAVGYVIGKENYQEILSASRLMKKIGIDELKFRVDFTQPGKIRKLSKEIIKNLEKAKEYSNSNLK